MKKFLFATLILTFSFVVKMNSFATDRFRYYYDVPLSEYHQVYIQEVSRHLGFGEEEIRLIFGMFAQESDFNPYCINYNTDSVGSIDYGMGQVNDYWNGAYAEQLGLEYKNNLEDNITASIYILKQNYKMCKDLGYTGESLMDNALSIYNTGKTMEKSKMGLSYVKAVKNRTWEYCKTFTYIYR